MGDGNLSNSNGRAVRLRITCDKKYPKLLNHIKDSISKMLPDNKVSLVNRKDNSIDVSCYSNCWENVLGWKTGKGSKMVQMVKIPNWILKDYKYTKECLRGIIQTDGSIFKDRKYTHVNVVSSIPTLALSIKKGMEYIGYKPNVQVFRSANPDKYTIRISKNVNKFIKDIKLWKE
ncbi:MAG: hypothetical protein KJZ60_01395 [Ignavibacteriaceae bacterium]|nr:hypothetical protein [Ignavibacteriaceae bacterium]